MERLGDLQAENRQLREALEFYADADNWGRDDWGVMAVIHGGEEYGNPGSIARAALGKKP